MNMGKLQPKLRFPEFKGDWKKDILDNVSEISSGGTPSRANAEYWNGEIPWVSTTLIDFNTISSTDEHITELGLKNSSAKLFPKGTILMAMYGQGKTRGKVAVLGIKASTNQACGAIIPNSNVINNIYLFQNLSKRYDEIRDLSNQGGQENLSGGIIKTLDITFPSIEEQTKIATFLSAVDDKLNLLKEKKALLEDYKKGMMQKIFSQELRFKDENGKDFADWEEKMLSEVANFRRGSFPQPYGLKKWYDEENGTPFIQVYDVDDNMKLKESTKNKISSLGAKQSVFVNEGTLVITIQGSIGRIAKTQYDAYVDRTLLIFQSYKLPIDVDYFKYVVFLLFEIEKTKAPGGIIKTITKEVLSSFNIMIPCLQEQSKIANFLSAIDEKIELVSQQIEDTQEYKKGLLQQMFC